MSNIRHIISPMILIMNISNVYYSHVFVRLRASLEKPGLLEAKNLNFSFIIGKNQYTRQKIVSMFLITYT